MGDGGCPDWELGTCSRGSVAMKLASLAIRATALSCTAASSESVKGSRSWEEKSC